jgi:uridine phosphorylase
MKIYVLTVGDQERLDLIAQQLGNIEFELIYSESEENFE